MYLQGVPQYGAPFLYLCIVNYKDVTKDGFWRINANRFLETLARARIRPEI